MGEFFQASYRDLVDSPNEQPWWHSIPLPDGRRIRGQNPDVDLQFKMWQALGLSPDGGLEGRSVLDIGANDGFFTLAALMAGAREVTALNSANWIGWPQNIEYACRAWGVQPEIITADFRTHRFDRRYDVIIFFGVLYHLDNVFACMEKLGALLEDDGTIFLETQMASVHSDLPVFEYASDIYPTIAPQAKSALGLEGVSNFLFPNEHAMRNLAYSYDLDCQALSGPHNRYTQEHPSRQIFRLSKDRKEAG